MQKSDMMCPVKDFASQIQTTLHQDQTIEEALISLRRRKIDEKIVYFYVIDDEGRLQGIVPTRQLLLKSHQIVKEIMDTSVICVKENQTLEEAMELMSSHQLLALPVIDEEQRLKGIIDVQIYLEESLDVANARHSRDVFQILGLNIEMGKQKSAWKSYKIRMPWIFCNMLGGISCAVISFFYQAVLAKVLLLAMFIPLILTLTESISMQSMTQSLHLVRHRHTWRRVFYRVALEGKVVILLALTCGIAVGIISSFFGEGGWRASVAIGSSLFVSISLSALIGASVPLVLHARSLDPKVASGPVVLMFADVITTTFYLSLASWLLL